LSIKTTTQPAPYQPIQLYCNNPFCMAAVPICSTAGIAI